MGAVYDVVTLLGSFVSTDRSRRTAVILTALDVETRAVLRHLKDRSEETVSGTAFFKGRFEDWDIAVAEAGPGNVGAAAIAVRAIGHFKPSVALFVGVAGGVKDVTIGDVVVATKVYGYEAGKDLASGFKARPDVLNTAHEIEQRARMMRQGDVWRNRLSGSAGHDTPTIFVAPIAAGEKVVASTRAATAKLLKQHYGDALAVEMEGKGFLEGVHITHPVQGGVVRGVSDLLSRKEEADEAGSQQKAADAASAVAFEILSGLGNDPVRTQAKPDAKFVETPPTFVASAYFEKGEVLARIGDPRSDEVRFAFSRAPDAFLRIIPTVRRERPIPLAELQEVVSKAELLRTDGFGGSSFVNKYGAILYVPDGSYRDCEAPLHRATQIFPNGELWAVSDRAIIRERNGRPAAWPLPLIPAQGFENIYRRALHRNVAFAAEFLGLTFPCVIELGIVGLAGAYLAVAQEDVRGPIQFDSAVVRHDLRDGADSTIDEALLTFFRDVYDKTGYARPAGLFGFPPAPKK